jgi:non-ribosomal peptide synthetase component F
MTVHRLQDWSRLAAARWPDSEAIACPGYASLSFQELETRSNRLCGLVRASGLQPGDRIAVAMGKTPTAIIAVLAGLKAGCILVPLDLKSPPLRLGRMLRTVEPALIVADEGASQWLAGEDFANERATAIGWLGQTEGPLAARFQLGDEAGFPADQSQAVEAVTECA